MSKKVLFWIFLIIGIIWIIGASYWYIWIENLDLERIRWEENFNSEDPDTQAFFRAVLVVVIPLLITALLFYFTGLLFGDKTKKDLHIIKKENEYLKSELAQHVDKIETMKVLYTGGKIQRKKELTPKEKKQVTENFDDDQKKTTEEKPEKNFSDIKKDDLKIIEGIGERIEFFLNENGIYTLEQLSQETVENLKNILETYGGASYKIHNPATWAEQAGLANNGKWEELNALKEKVRKS
ncbi:MAG: hypothetical protein LBP34_05675 [Flavobacteriaceae bacterium]|jgi:predicted flap endonuclease-1-like 5' DNA nuclease|nr:hypothetical protein [Flavobacteriaceae bacterium]